MNKIGAKIFFAFNFLLTLIVNCYGQQQAVDTSLASKQLGTLTTNFYNGIREQSRLYNGPEYDDPNPAIKGNPFYNDTNQFTTGDVFYDGFEYKNVPLLYDINRDLIVVQLANKVSKVYLLKNRVADFTVQSHRFVNINADTLSKPGSIASGFYDQLYKGKCEVLVKRRKNIQEGTVYNNIESFYNPVTNFFIKNAGAYIGISSLGNVLKVFTNKRKELEQYVKANKIKFKDNPEQAMVMIASYYDQINK